MKDRGELDGGVEWSGRTNDSKKVNLQVRIAKRVESLCLGTDIC